MTWRSREPRGPRKMAERLADRRSSRYQEGRVRVCYATYFPQSDSANGDSSCTHTTHVHLENVAMHRIARRLWGHGSWGKQYKQLSAPTQSSPIYLHSFYFKVVLEIRFRATFHHVQHPSILPLSKFPITLPPPFFRLLVFQLTTYFPGSYLYLAKCPGKTAPPTETMSASLTKSLESQEEGGRVRTFARPAPPGRWTGPGKGNNTAQGRFGTVRQNSSLRVLGK